MDVRKKEKIAVIGLAGLFPGSETIDEFWDNLVANRDLVRDSDSVDFGAPPRLFFDPEKGKLDRCYSLRGGYVRDFKFDPEGFRLDASLLEAQDPQFKWSLYVAREALRDSGYWDHDKLDRCGAVVGNLSFPTRYSRQLLSAIYADMASEVIEALTGESVEVPAALTGYPADKRSTLLTNAPAALIAQAAGLKGTHYALDAACASSLYAVKLACDELHTGRADLMLAGAVSGADPLFIHMGFSYFHAYARQHELSAPMDRQSGGLTSAEGAGMMVLKRLADAQRDGDKIYAVIDGVGLSNDGKGKFLLSPNPKGQRLAFERAYAQSDLSPADIDYLECHATGTPLGDTTEFNSISDFFVEGGSEPPLVGSVKSNMGHLLTAAGMTSMLKVILAMQHRYLPATIKVESPLSSSSGRIGADQIVRENRPWPVRNHLPHAAINAFGFGGTNAHLILSAYDEKAAPAPKADPLPRPALAITGMDVHFGDCDSLEAYYLSLFEGRQHFRDLPGGRWKGMENLEKTRKAFGLPGDEDRHGAWVETFELDLLRFKIQPKEAERLMPQQTFMLKVANGAIEDAGLGSLEGKGANIAVITAMESELEIHHRMGRWDLSWQVNEALHRAGLSLDEAREAYLLGQLKDAIFLAHEDHSPSEHTGFIGNIMSSRISALMDFTGPAFTISSNENTVYKALEVARNLLTMGEVDAVVLGAIDLTGSLESVISRQVLNPMNTGSATLSFDRGSNGWMPGEGAGAIVLKRAADAGSDRVYAYIDEVAVIQSGPTDLRGAADAATVEAAARQVFQEQGLTPAAVGLLELSASGIPAEDEPELAGLARAYGYEAAIPSCAIGSSKAHIGHTFAASGMAAIIRSALALYHRFIPGVPQWQAPKDESVFAGTPFYVPGESRPWIPDPGQDSLRAAISGLSSDGTCAHVLLSEGHHPDPAHPGAYLLKGGERLFPLRGDSAASLAAAFDELEAAISEEDFRKVSDRWCRQYAGGDAAGSDRTVALIAASAAALRREIGFFRRQLATAWAAGNALQTPSGSYFTARPLAAEGKLAFVYPGSGTAYTGLGAALFQCFPGLYGFVKDRVNHLSGAFFSEYLYPRSLVAPDAAAAKAAEKELQTNALPMMAIGCTFAAAYTQLVQEYLGIKADSVIGYSMGETSAMWYGQGIWDPRRAEEKFIKAPLFREKVGGRMTLLSDLWNMPEEEARRRWTSRLISLPAGMAGYDSLADWYYQAVAPAEDKVFLTFVNTDKEIIISGDREAVEGVLQRYELAAVELEINNVVHHEFCRQVTDELLEMHRLPIERRPEKTYYSGVTGAPLTVETEALAHNAAEVCCQTVNWPGLIRKMAEDGHRLFVELGAGATCTRWIGEILPADAYLAIPSDRRGAGVLRNILSLVARLLAHGVAVDLRPFFEMPSEKKARPALSKTIRIGGLPYQAVALKEANIEYFANAISRQPVLAGAAAGMDLEDSYEQEPPAPPAMKDLFSNKQTTTTVSKMVIESQKALKKGENGLLLQNYDDPAYLQGKEVIWDEEDLLTFATGKISDVFGEEYAIIDTYRRRVMLPMPPYLLVSRVTRLEARMNEYKPSLITTEYDIPYNSDFATDGQIPWAVAVESGQCDLLLISYLGIDFQNKGEYVYRLLDCTLTFLDDLPFEGQTLRYDIRINNFVRSGNNLLFFFSYECFVEDRMVLKMEDGCAGFFSDEELAVGQGVVYKAKEIEERNNRPRQFFAPLLECDKTTFSREDLLALTQGDLVACFGEAYHADGRNPSLRMPPEKILMLDRITRLDLQGGSSGLGFIEAEKDMHPDDWYFPCHFRDDEVLAGSLQAEGGGQLLRFYMLLLGMQRLTKDARFQPVLDIPQKVICRKEVPAKEGKLIYRMDVREVGLTPEPYVIADLEILYDGYVAVYFENLGLRLQEKDNPQYLKTGENRVEGIYVKPVDRPVLFNEYHITQFALGPVHRCFGEEFRVFEGRDLSRQPNTDLQFISRVLEIRGQRHVFKDQPEIIAEYDVPADAWYYRQNAGPEMPYSVLMEIALQPCGFLGAYLGSTLQVPDKDLFFRNLDGDGELLRRVDLRGKTITNRVCLVSHTSLAGTVLQRYTFELSVDGAPFYRGSSSFGFFSREDLSSQAGLDQGKKVAPWLRDQTQCQRGGFTFKLDSLFGKMKLYRSVNPAAPELHLAGGQLDFLDTATIIREGGKYDKGYIYATKAVKPYEWFFTCHFYQDPVMPGSLGVEAIIQALQLLALQKGLGEGLKNVAFRHPAPHRTVWKYRGQILRHDREMNLEVHLKEVVRSEGRITLVADASLWKGDLRIYELTDLAVEIS